MFKDRFRAWHLYKNLQPDEALGLLRIKAYRNAVDLSVRMQFSRYGRPISERRLERYLRDHPSLQSKLQRHPPDEDTIDNLIEIFLPSRGLVALGTPQKYLRDEEWSYITESAIFSLQIFHTIDYSWKIDGQNLSIVLIGEATWEEHEYGVMAELQADRDSAWGRIKEAFQLFQTDMENSPDSFALDILVLFSVLVEEGEVLHLARQLAQHLSLLSGLVLGAQSPYHAMFVGLAKIMQQSLSTVSVSFTEFYKRVSEVLIDIAIARVHSGSADGTYSKKLGDICEVVGPPKRDKYKVAL